MVCEMRSNEKLRSEHLAERERGIIAAAEQWVRELIKKNPHVETTDHGWHHINLVRRTAIVIANQEHAEGRETGDRFLIELIVLFHELVDGKINIFPDTNTAQENMKTWMHDQAMKDDDINLVLDAVARQSYSVSGFTQETFESPEARIAQDADRLLAIGANGILRAVVWSPLLGKPIFDAEKPPRDNITRRNYRSELASTFNFLFEAAFDRALRLNTATARKMAGPRVKFMIDFIRQYLAEQIGVDIRPFEAALEAKVAQLRAAGILSEEEGKIA